MNISGAQLRTQHDRALRDWPWLHEVNDAHGLPPHALCGVGSRETNLTNVSGDHGHAHGVWQVSDGDGRTWHRDLPPNFDSDIRLQAETAARLLAEQRRAGETSVQMFNRYNSNQPATERTTGRDYGPDVEGRRYFLMSDVPPEDLPIDDSPPGDPEPGGPRPGQEPKVPDVEG